MTANLHTVLKQLTAEHPDAARLHHALDKAAVGQMYPALAKETRALFYPKLPAGMRFAKLSFWAVLHSSDVWMRAMKGCSARQNAAARYIVGQERFCKGRGYAWPPVPRFEAAPELPQVRDGKDGANAWTPRTGKE